MEIDTLEKKSVKNLYAWLIAILPFVVSFPPAEYDNYVMVISFVIGLGLLVADRINLTESGYEPPSFLWGLLLPPVYLWKRATVLGSNRLLCIVWCVAFAASFIVYSFNTDSALEEAACPTVTTILKQNNGTEAPKCMKVTIQDKVTDKFYKATATLDNGNDINITIEMTGDENFYVRVPNYYLSN
ncbi:Uncharacterised protein [Salmonella enterica subsp. enterica serovar Hartford]|nr:Uncharacterised protein [Salmonella enterica subsp. enterica serovar Hartford]